MDFSFSISSLQKSLPYKCLFDARICQTYLIKCNQPSASQPAFAHSKVTMKALEQGVKICSKLTIKTPERWQRHRSAVFIVNFEHVIAGWVIRILF